MRKKQMRKTGWRKLTAMLTALLMMLNTVPLGALADEIFGSTPDSESSGQNLWTEQYLYNVAMVNSAWYRLARTKIIAKTVESYNVDASLQPDEYIADAYPFKDLVINYKGDEYHYRADGGARDPEVNYYTVSLEKPNTPILVKTRIGGATGYLVPSDQQYGTIDSFLHFHRGYKIDLDKASDRRYTVRFLTWDGKNIQTFNRLEYGKKVKFSGVTPTRNQTTDKVYTFSGWNPEITDPDGTVTVTGDADYTAVFEEKARTYEITWKDETGAVIQKTQVPYGDKPSFDYYAQDYHSHDKDNYTYTFEKWNPDPVPVTGNATYRAVVSKEARVSDQDLYVMVQNGRNSKYYYRFGRIKNGIKTVNAATIKRLGVDLDPDTYELKIPEDYFNNIVFTVDKVDYQYSPAEKTGEYDAYYTLEFNRVALLDRINNDSSWFDNESGWVGNAKSTYPADATNGIIGFHVDYVATLHPSTMPFYSVTFVDEDGTALKEATQYKKGTKADDIEKPDDPTKEADAQYTYIFDGWSPEVTDVTGNVTYKAIYRSVPNQYTITFDSNGGSEVAAITQDYGTAVTAPADPTREGYTFAGWDAAVPATMPAQNQTLTAQWKIDDSLKIIAYTDWPEGRMGFPGAVVNLSSELIGFENKEYTLQWQHSLDGTTWIDEPGANEDTYTFVLYEQNARYIWRIIAIDVRDKE